MAIRKAPNSPRNAKYGAPASMSKPAARMRSSALRATRQAMNAAAPATSAGGFGPPVLNHRLFTCIVVPAPSGRSLMLAYVELVLPRRGLHRIEEPHRGRLRPRGHVRADARTVADQPQHFTGAHAVEQLLRLDDRARTGHAADVEHRVGHMRARLALLDVEAHGAARQLLGPENLVSGVPRPREKVVLRARTIRDEQQHLTAGEAVEQRL